MTDLPRVTLDEAVVRAALHYLGDTIPNDREDVLQALAALDSLLAERDEAREELRLRTDGYTNAINLANHTNDLLLAERGRYREALERVLTWAMTNFEDSGEMSNAMDRIEDIARAALSEETE